jgi:hypothetical protein
LLGADNPEPNKAARKIWRYGSIVILIVALFSGWTLWSRWQENRDLEYKAAQQKAAKEHDADEKTVDTLGGNRFEIISFYASPGIIRRGDSAQLCYGVSNTKSLRLDPPVASVWPSYDRCFDISPTKDTTYTLTAGDGDGNSKSASFTLKVQ